MVVVVMKIIANALLNLSESIAYSSGSGRRIIVDNNEINIKYVDKKDTDKRVWEDFYKNSAIYLKNSANPVKIDVSRDKLGNFQKENLVSTDYYATVMRLNTIKQMYGVDGRQEQELEKFLYAIIGLILLVAMLVVM